MTTQVQGVCQVDVVDDPIEIQLYNVDVGKPFLRLTFPNGQKLNISFNLAEMLGGIGSGARLRYEDMKDPRFVE